MGLQPSLVLAKRIRGCFFPPRGFNSQQFFNLAFAVGRKPQRSKLRPQGTIIEPGLYFPIWSPAQASSSSIIIDDTTPTAEERWPKSHLRLESPSHTTSVLTGGRDAGMGTRREASRPVHREEAESGGRGQASWRDARAGSEAAPRPRP